MKADVAIIGGGITGLAAGASLLKAGKSVVIVDDATRKSASWINAGTVALQNKISAIHEICLEAIHEWDALNKELNGELHYVRDGGYRVAVNEEQLHDLEARRDELLQLGISCDLLSRPMIEAKLPWFSDRVRFASYCPYDGFASPLRARLALLSRYQRLGGSRVLSSLTGVEFRAGRYHLTFRDTDAIQADKVIIAAGAWSSEVARFFGAEIETNLKVNILSVTERVAQFMSGTITTHAAGRFTLKQFPNGSCILGGGYSGIGDLTTNTADIDLAQLQMNLRAQCDIVPSLKSMLLVRTWAGFSETAFSNRPALDFLDTEARVWIVLTGDIGFTLGPLFGRMAANAVCKGTPPFFLPIELANKVPK